MLFFNLQKIPRIDYNQKELKTWGHVYDKLQFYIENKFLN